MRAIQVVFAEGLTARVNDMSLTNARMRRAAVSRELHDYRNWRCSFDAYSSVGPIEARGVSSQIQREECAPTSVIG